MSDSDDTDVLLLIPPDFFAVHSSNSEDSFLGERYSDGDIVTGLISQVCNLENRLSIIESKESLSTAVADRKEDMAQQVWHNLNASTPRSSRATSLPPTPTSSGPAVYYRANSFPSPSKSVPISPDRNNYYGKSVFSRNGPQNSPSAYGEIPSDFKVRNYVAHLPNRRDPKQTARSRNAETMKEIDSFFENLRGRYGNRSRDTNLSSPGTHVQQLGLEEVDRLLEKVEADQQQMEAKLSARERQFGLPVGEEVIKATRIKAFPGDSISSVPDLNLGVRKLWDDKSGQPPHRNAANGFNKPKEGEAVEEPCTYKKYAPLGKDAALLSNGRENEESQNKKMFQSRRRLDLDNSTRPDIARLPDEGNKSVLDVSASDIESDALHGGPMPRPGDYSISLETTPARSAESPALRPHHRSEQHEPKSQRKGLQDKLRVPANVLAGPPPVPPLMSLADLWGGKNTTQSLTLEQCLEEEKCRREHCENLVQSLQTRLLEAQQRLAVAQRVDSEKDAAIKHLRSTWTRIMEAWNGLEDERDGLANELEALRSAFQSEKEQLIQKLAKCEGELSKALDLAHGYKEQSEAAERMRCEQLEQLGEKVREVEKKLAAATQANSEAQAREAQLREQLAKETEKATEFQKTLTTVNKSLLQREADVAILTEEKSSLQTRLKEERTRGDTLQQSRDTIRKEAEDAGKRERALQAEVRQLNQQLSSIRSELRDFYQEQLERAVRDKLTEFQGQLDAAETALHREAENRELAMAELAARQLKQLNNKHKQEVALLEQRHAEELHLAHLQKTEAEQSCLELRKRLEEHESNASHLAQRLHGIMQNQWREALSVVSGPRVVKSESKASSQVAEKGDHGGGGDIGGGQSWLLVKQEQQENRRRQRQQKQQEQSSNFHSLPARWSGMSSNDETPFEQDGLLTQRSTSTVKLQPQASNSSGDSGEDLKKYIKMLLDRAPGRPFESSTTMPATDSLKEGKSNEKLSTSNGRDGRNSGGKPPWK